MIAAAVRSGHLALLQTSFAPVGSPVGGACGGEGEGDEDGEEGPDRSLLGEGGRPFDPSTFCITWPPTRCPSVVAAVWRVVHTRSPLAALKRAPSQRRQDSPGHISPWVQLKTFLEKKKNDNFTKGNRRAQETPNNRPSGGAERS